MEHTRETRDMAAVAGDRVSGYRAGADRHGLRTRDVMTKDVITATTSDTVFSAAIKMSENRVSCLVILGDELVTGILTEKDILRAVGREETDFGLLTVRETMSSPVEVISPDMSVIEAGQIMESKDIRRLPVVQDAKLLGIVTQTDITRGLISLSPLGYICDIMSTNVATVGAAATVAEAARIMSSNGISCVVAMHRNDVAGIVSEKDVLRRVVALHRNATQTHVRDVMSFPVAAVPPSYSILSASKKMEKMRLHRLVIMEGKKVCGIVTQTDVMRAVRTELERVEVERDALMTELATLAQCVTQDMEKLQDLVSETPDSAGIDREAVGATDMPE